MRVRDGAMKEAIREGWAACTAATSCRALIGVAHYHARYGSAIKRSRVARDCAASMHRLPRDAGGLARNHQALAQRDLGQVQLAHQRAQ